jgi:hypothetical protein
MASGSPIVSRALNFVSSPITPRRIWLQRRWRVSVRANQMRVCEAEFAIHVRREHKSRILIVKQRMHSKTG